VCISASGDVTQILEPSEGLQAPADPEGSWDVARLEENGTSAGGFSREEGSEVCEIQSLTASREIEWDPEQANLTYQAPWPVGPSSPERAHRERDAESPHRIIGQGDITPAESLTFYHVDHLGSPRVITDPNGNVVSTHKYLPFGEELTPPPSTNTHEFTGHERDAETGLDYMLARYYASSLGRFLGVDPLAESAKRSVPQTWNRYTYSLNNPLRYVDPTGEETKVAEQETKKEHVKSKQTGQEVEGQTYVQVETTSIDPKTGEVDVTITIVSEVTAQPVEDESAVSGEEADHREQYKEAIQETGNDKLHLKIEGAMNSVTAQGKEEGWSREETIKNCEEAVSAVISNAISEINAAAQPKIDEYHKKNP
jgi:RHS repeat-associated protein